MYITAWSGRVGTYLVTIYQDAAGNIAFRVGRTDRTGYGTRSWRNNNPGNVKAFNWAWAQAHGAIGIDAGGFAIFPDYETGWAAKDALLHEKYGDYNSIREMLKGKFDENGNYIPNTGWAPKSDDNNPDLYANTIRDLTGLDVDNKKLSVEWGHIFI